MNPDTLQSVYYSYLCSMTILIADGGSTKTQWATLTDGHATGITVTQGINPVHQSQAAIARILRCELLPALTSVPARVEFYGAGCRGTACDTVRGAIMAVLGLDAASVTVDSDIVGAAKALFGESTGIACILGTGSNCALYSDGHIEHSVPPLGYILGDEGGGAALGRRFLNALFRGRLGADTTQAFYAWYAEREKTTDDPYTHIIGRVYCQPLANRFLASLSLFIGARVGEDKQLLSLVEDNFRAFFTGCVALLGRRDLPVGAVGSIAWHYKDIFTAVAREQGYEVVRILRSPLSV